MSVLYFSCQGLAALCEKEENPQYKAELPGVYEKLLLMYERWHTLSSYAKTKTANNEPVM